MYVWKVKYSLYIGLLCSREYECVLGCRHVLVVSVSSSGVGTVFALLFFRLEKLLFYKGIFFQCSVFFICPPLSTLFLFTEFVYGIHLIFFQSSCIESLSLRCFLPSRPWERPHVRARRSSFSPRRPRKAERACRVFSRAYRAKRVAVVESWKVVWGFKTSTFILVRFRFCFFLIKKRPKFRNFKNISLFFFFLLLVFFKSPK